MELSIFVRTLGNSPQARIMDYLITCRGMPVHQSDVIRNAHVSKKTLISIWKEMIKEGILKHDRTIGKAELYVLNKEDFRIKKLVELYNICLEKEANTGLKNIEILA